MDKKEVRTIDMYKFYIYVQFLYYIRYVRK